MKLSMVFTGVFVAGSGILIGCNQQDLQPRTEEVSADRAVCRQTGPMAFEIVDTASQPEIKIGEVRNPRYMFKDGTLDRKTVVGELNAYDGVPLDFQADLAGKICTLGSYHTTKYHMK